MGVEKYFAKDLTDENKREIIALILQEVEDKGSSRVGYHAGKVLQRGDNTPYNIKSKIEATIIKDGKYKSRIHPNFKNDFEILFNPDYKKQGFWAKHPFYEKLAIALFTAGLTYLVSSQVARKQRINQLQADKRQDSLIQGANDSISRIQKRIEDFSSKKSVDTTAK